ncbi:MAG: alpha-ketoglutarate-dependent dioxygenase AlkB [Pseudomonadota bacterium]|nr:alpha-ketoglutarate-dependent dioxygenase AlkB [Pseudomonadota bacterium]
MTMQQAASLELFTSGDHRPKGLLYQPEFIAPDEEEALLRDIATLPLAEAKYKAYTARRRIVSFGSSYDFSDNTLHDEIAIPPFLLPLRERAAQWVAIPPDDFGHALVTEYRPGTPLGWHRDVPQFSVIVGISLGSPCEMRFRPYPLPSRGDRNTQHEHRARGFTLELAPRSVYVLRDDARWQWQHSIVATKSLRYSITFRSRRASAHDHDRATPASHESTLEEKTHERR